MFTWWLSKLISLERGHSFSAKKRIAKTRLPIHMYADVQALSKTVIPAEWVRWRIEYNKRVAVCLCKACFVFLRSIRTRLVPNGRVTAVLTSHASFRKSPKEIMSRTERFQRTVVYARSIQCSIIIGWHGTNFEKIPNFVHAKGKLIWTTRENLNPVRRLYYSC